MKTTIYLASQFRDAFRQADRQENFSYEGLGLLFDYLEEYEGATGEELELDVISICCEYNEDTYEGIAKNYIIDLEGCESEQDMIEVIRDYLNDNTSLVGEPLAGTFLYVAF